MPKKLNLIGEKFGRLEVIEPAENQGKKTAWLCKCNCGKTCVATTDSLRSGRKQSCGCLRSEAISKRNSLNAKDLIGQRFGKLVVKAREGSRRGHATWLCQCDCGGSKIVTSMELLNGDTSSCGCLKSSLGESKIEFLLKNFNIPYKKEVEFNDLVSEAGVPLRFDFGIFNSQGEIYRIVEYDGEQHYLDKSANFFKKDTLKQRQARDAQKNRYCLNNGISLVRIPYWEKNNICLDMIMGDKFLIKD